MEQENSSPRVVPVEFTGSGSEYFGIWIVNILLTILTLGIYHAWAKVRTRKYFYNNTRIDGSSFDYHANPIAILKGWLIVVVALVAQNVLMNINMLYGLIATLVLVVFIPWAMVRSRVFNLVNTSYRNVRFFFEREYKELYTIFLIAPLPIVIGYGLVLYEMTQIQESGDLPSTNVMNLGGVLTMVGFLLIPYYMQRFYHFVISRSSFGRTRFENKSTVENFYMIYLKAMGLGVLWLVAIFSLVGLMVATKETAGGAMSAIFAVLMVAVYMGGFFVITYYIEAAKLNEIWGKTSIDGNRFVSKLKARGFIWLMLSNTLLIVLTLGLYIPWAKVRMTRYRLDHLELEVNGDLDNFVARGREEMDALGAELGDAMDFEIAL